MSIGYNLVQFIIESDTLNETMANIFRNFKISKDNKELIIDMVNAHIESEKIRVLSHPARRAHIRRAGDLRRAL